MPLPLRLKIRLAIVIASLCIPILFLLVTMIPGVPMFETSFVYLPSTLHIDGVDVSGVTQISVSFATFSLTTTNLTHIVGYLVRTPGYLVILNQQNAQESMLLEQRE